MAIDLLSPSPAAPRYCGIPPRELRLELQELRLELRCRTWTAAPRCGVPMMGVIKCYKMVEVFTSYNHYKPTFCPDPIRRSPVSIIFPWKILKNQSGWTPKKKLFVCGNQSEWAPYSDCGDDSDLPEKQRMDRRWPLKQVAKWFPKPGIPGSWSKFSIIYGQVGTRHLGPNDGMPFARNSSPFHPEKMKAICLSPFHGSI